MARGAAIGRAEPMDDRIKYGFQLVGLLVAAVFGYGLAQASVKNLQDKVSDTTLDLGKVKGSIERLKKMGATVDENLTTVEREIAQQQAAIAAVKGSTLVEIGNLAKSLANTPDVAALLSKVTATDAVVEALQRRLDSPPATGWEPEQSYGGGANAMGRTAECPPNQTMVGIEIVTGGTCGTRCDPDGRPLHKFRIKCAPR